MTAFLFLALAAVPSCESRHASQTWPSYGRTKSFWLAIYKHAPPSGGKTETAGLSLVILVSGLALKR